MTLRTGTLTFLFTDIEGSTRLWDRHPEAMRRALVRHSQIVAESVAAHGGTLVRARGEGDSTFSVFVGAADALAAACALQRALSAEPWLAEAPIRVRAALHTGIAHTDTGEYNSSAVNRCARLRGIAHGGQTLLSSATFALTRDQLPEGISLRDLGSHRLKDLERPEQVYQLLHPDLRDDFPPLRSLDALPTNLPQQLTTFVGRVTELSEVRRLLAETRLLTLAGAGGVGKTRLALQVAADLLDDYPDGVYLTELAALSDPSLVPRAVAAALGLREEPGEPLTRTLTEYLRPKRLLLLLDNCEHLLPACARLADTLLKASPNVRLLATSREPLAVPGELVWRVPSLLQPDAERPTSPTEPVPSALMQFDAVRLFVERAVLHRPAFDLNQSNAFAVTQVCRRLDGIPLAIELAAARVKALPVEQIADRLDDRFRLLTGGGRTVLPRQQTLRALIDWSYDLLSPAERVLFRRLSVFAGGWTLEAAEAICSGDSLDEGEVLDLLTGLVDKSLVLYEEPQGQARYRLLETVRQYARDRLAEAAEGERLYAQHGMYFLELAEKAEPHLDGRDAAEWLRQLALEHDNLRSALEGCLAAAVARDPPYAQFGLRLAAALWRFWATHGHLSEGRARLAATLAAPGAEMPTVARARALVGTGYLAWTQADYPEARAPLEEGLTISRTLGDDQVMALALTNLGNIAFRQSDFAGARLFFEQIHALYTKLQEPGGIASALNNLGATAQQQGDYAAARHYYEEALAVNRTLGSRAAVATNLNNLGVIALAQGDLPAARVLHQESLAIKRALEDRRGIAASLNNLGNVAHVEGDLVAARARFEESLANRRDLQDRWGIASSLHNLGIVLRDEGDLDRAGACFRESLTIYRDIDDREGIAYPLEGIAMLATLQGDAIRSARLLGAADALRQEIGAPVPLESQEDYEQTVAAARAALGTEAFEAAWAEGASMTLEHAIVSALGDDVASKDPGRRGPDV